MVGAAQVGQGAGAGDEDAFVIVKQGGEEEALRGVSRRAHVLDARSCLVRDPHVDFDAEHLEDCIYEGT